MADQVHDQSIAGTAKDNIPTMSKTMDEVHDNPEDISNKASGYKVQLVLGYLFSFPSPPLPSSPLPSSPLLSPPLLSINEEQARERERRLTIPPYQATLSNPNVSDSAKKNAEEMLGKLGGEDAFMKNNGKGE